MGLVISVPSTTKKGAMKSATLSVVSRTMRRKAGVRRSRRGRLMSDIAFLLGAPTPNPLPMLTHGEGASLAALAPLEALLSIHDEWGGVGGGANQQYFTSGSGGRRAPVWLSVLQAQ